MKENTMTLHTEHICFIYCCAQALAFVIKMKAHNRTADRAVPNGPRFFVSELYHEEN